MSYRGQITKQGSAAPVSRLNLHGRAECRVAMTEADGTVRLEVLVNGGQVSRALLTVRRMDVELLIDTLAEAARALRAAERRRILAEH